MMHNRVCLLITTYMRPKEVRPFLCCVHTLPPWPCPSHRPTALRPGWCSTWQLHLVLQSSEHRILDDKVASNTTTLITTNKVFTDNGLCLGTSWATWCGRTLVQPPDKLDQIRHIRNQLVQIWLWLRIWPLYASFKLHHLKYRKYIHVTYCNVVTAGSSHGHR